MDSPIVNKSYKFALNIIHTYQKISSEKKEFILSKQLLKSGTSIGANIEESQGAQSKKDFIAKLHISYKEARETRYWLRLLKDSKYLNPELADLLIRDCEELIRLLVSILKSSKSNP